MIGDKSSNHEKNNVFKRFVQFVNLKFIVYTYVVARRFPVHAADAPVPA